MIATTIGILIVVSIGGIRVGIGLFEVGYVLGCGRSQVTVRARVSLIDFHVIVIIMEGVRGGEHSGDQAADVTGRWEGEGNVPFMPVFVGVGFAKHDVGIHIIRVHVIGYAVFPGGCWCEWLSEMFSFRFRRGFL